MTTIIRAKVTTPSELRAFNVQHPKTAKLFGIIVMKWKMSHARRRSENGYWAAYTSEEWCAWIGLRSRSALKEHLDRLEKVGLIERTRGKFGGGGVRSFIRPTSQGLFLSHHRPQDWKHLGADPPTVGTAPTSGALPIEDVFKAAYLANSGITLVVITKAELAHLKGIVKALPHDGAAVLDHCVRRWMKFATHVAEAKGFNPAKAPTQPSAKYVRENLQAAYEFTMKALAPKETGFEPKPMPTPVPVQPIAQKEEDKPATLEEVLAIDAGTFEFPE